MEQAKKLYIIALATLLVAAILLSATIGGILYKRNGTDRTVERSNDVYTSFGAGFTDIKITDESSALQAVDSVKNRLKITNTHEEIRYNITQKYAGNKYYRLQQYVGEVPVYGRTLIVGADKNGNPLSLNSNYRPIKKAGSSTPLVSRDVVRQNIAQAVSARAGKDVTVKESAVSEKGLAYYDFGEEKTPTLTYVVPVKIAGETVEYIANAETGEILEETVKVPVPNTEISLLNHGESGALKVAYEELFDSESKGDLQIAQDPAANGYPVEYRGENWASTSTVEDNGHVNTNYTVFTHAITQMLDGMSGTTEPIPESDVITLLVGTLLRFNLDETFHQAADTFYSEAQYLASTGKLSSEQLSTVASAFAAAGLPVTDDASAVVAPTVAEKKATSGKKIDVVKTMDYLRDDGSYIEYEYKYDFDAKVLTVDHSIHGNSEWQDVGADSSILYGMIYPGMFEDHPEISATLPLISDFNCDLLLAYHPAILSGTITAMVHVDKNTTEYGPMKTRGYTFHVENGRLTSYDDIIYDSDFAETVYFKYDKNGRVTEVNRSGFNSIDNYEHRIDMKIQYTDSNDKLVEVRITRPGDDYDDEIKVTWNSNQSSAQLEYNYLEFGAEEAGVKVDTNGTLSFDKNGNLLKMLKPADGTTNTFNYSENNKLVEHSINSKAETMDGSTYESDSVITYTYQTIQLP